MASRVCPYCQGLNGASEERCYRCGRRLPGPLQSSVLSHWRAALGSEAPMTRLVIGLELLVFALCVLADRRFPLGLGDGFRTSTLIRFGALVGTALESEPWRLLSAVFVHAGLLHVGMNMLMFSWLGQRLEQDLGAARSLLLFLASGVLGFVASALWTGPSLLTVGASGGVFGQIGAFVGLLYARRDPEWKKALVRSLIYAALLTFAIPGVDSAAHFGGFAAGAVLGFTFQKELTLLRLGRLAAALAGLGLLASVASVVLSTQSLEWQRFRAWELRNE